MVSACAASSTLYQVLDMLSMPGKRQTACSILVSVRALLAEVETGALAIIALCKRYDGIAFVRTDVQRSGTPHCLACVLFFPNTHITQEKHRFGSPVSPHPVSCTRLWGSRLSPWWLSTHRSRSCLGRCRPRGVRPVDVLMSVESLECRNPTQPQKAAAKRHHRD